MSNLIKSITVFRIFIGTGLFIIFFFFSIGNNKRISSVVVQDEINKLIPFSFDKGNGQIIVNKAELIPMEKERLGFLTEFYYDEQYSIVKSTKKFFGFENNITGEVMSLKFSFDIERDEGLIYFDNISNISVFWKGTNKKVKIFKNKRFVKSFVSIMEDIKLYRIGNSSLLKNKNLLQFLDIHKLGSNTDKIPFDIIVNYGLKGFYSFLLFFLILITFSREISLLFILIYNKLFLNRKNYICAKSFLTEKSCSQSLFETIYNMGFVYGIYSYFKIVEECEESYLKIKRIKKGKKINEAIKVTSFNNCFLSFFKK